MFPSCICIFAELILRQLRRWQRQPLRAAELVYSSIWPVQSWDLQKRKVLKSNLHCICKILISPGNSSAIRAPVGANKNVGNMYVPLCVKLEEEENNKSSWQSYRNMILEIEVSRGLVDHLVLKTEMSLEIEIMKQLMAIPLLITICWVLKMTIKISLLTKGVRYGVCCFAPRQQCFEWQLVGQLSNAEYTNCYIVHCISLHVLNVWMFWMTTHGPSLRRLVHAEYVNRRLITAILYNVLHCSVCNPFHSACRIHKLRYFAMYFTPC